MQTVLEGYLTPQANELAANFRALLLHAVMETVAEMTDPQNHGRGSIRGGSQDGYDYGGMTPDDLQVLFYTTTAQNQSCHPTPSNTALNPKL